MKDCYITEFSTQFVFGKPLFLLQQPNVPAIPSNGLSVHSMDRQSIYLYIPSHLFIYTEDYKLAHSSRCYCIPVYIFLGQILSGYGKSRERNQHINIGTRHRESDMESNI